MEITLETVVFYFLAAFITVFSILTVTTHRMVRSATYLLFVLFGTAGIYFLLGYTFLGSVQIMVYAGGIVVLYVFSILLTSGEGDVIENKCKECAGEGIVYGEEVVTVKIPAGVAEGMQLSMGGKGNAGKHNGVPGDLLILIEEEQDKELIRDENDLIYNLLLSFPTAALGGAVEIPTIDGKVKVKIESGTQPGKVLRLRGKGLPNVNGYGTGDLLHCGVFAMKLANNSVVVLVCESRLQLIMMPSEHQRIIWVLTNLLHKVGS